jgi:hypothetical protein
MDTAEALRATSDALLRDLEVLGAIEEEKRTIPAGDPRLVELAARIEQIAHRLLGHSTDQRELSEAAHEEVSAGAVDAAVAIEETPRPMAAILADWREAERRSAAMEADTADAIEAAALVDALRQEYRRAFDAAQGAEETGSN